MALRHGPLIALGLAIVVAVGVRLYMLTTPIMRLEGDEGVTAVMAQRILDGDLPMYFGVQSYQGALEQYLQAAVLWVLPDTPFTLRLVQVALVVLVLVVTYMVTNLVTRSRWGGVLAAALLALGPYYFTWKSIKSHGGYDGAMLAGMAMVLAALLLRRGGPRQALAAFSVGLAAGIAIWENPTSLYMAIPAAIWAIGSARGSLMRLGAWGLGGLAVGVIPMVVNAVRTGVLLPTGTGQQPATSITQRLRNFAEPVLPDFLGISGTLTSASSSLARTITAAALVLVIAAAWHRRKGIWNLLCLRAEGRTPIDLILVGLIITPFLYAASPFTWYTGEPRYLFTAYPFAAIAATAGLMAIRQRDFRVPAVVTTLIVAAFLPSMALASASRGTGTLVSISTGSMYTEDLPVVADELRRSGVRTAYANTWLSGPLQFATGGRVLVASGGWTQFPDTDAAVRRSPSPAVVVPTDPGADRVLRTLRKSGRRFEQAQAGRFTIFSDVSPAWHPRDDSFLFYPA